MRTHSINYAITLLVFSATISFSEGILMDNREIAPGVFMPVMSIGVGGRESRDAYNIVFHWLTLGGRGIDTALNYGNQDQVRKAMIDSGIPREDLFLTTKIPDCNTTNIQENIETDLNLLGTTYIDLMLLHSPRNGDCLEAMKILEHYYLGTKKKIRAIGISNFDVQDLEPIIESGVVSPHVNQIKLNLEVKDMDTINYCTEHNIAVEAYTPLGKGNVTHYPVVQKIAKSHNVSTYQVALKWILQHGWILTFQSSSPEHQAMDANVFHFNLTCREMEQLDQINGGWIEGAIE